MVCSTDAEDAKILLGIPSASTVNNVINDQLALNTVHIWLDNQLQILRKSLLFFAKIWKIDYPKVTKIWLVNFENSTSKQCI